MSSQRVEIGFCIHVEEREALTYLRCPCGAARPCDRPPTDTQQALFEFQHKACLCDHQWQWASSVRVLVKGEPKALMQRRCSMCMVAETTTSMNATERAQDAVPFVQDAADLPDTPAFYDGRTR